MAAVDPSLVARLPLFAGFGHRGTQRHTARSPLGAVCEEQPGIRGGPGRALLLRAAARPGRARPRRRENRSWCAMSRPARSLASRWRSGCRVIPPPRPPSTTASCWPGHRRHGHAWWRNFPHWPPTRCRPSAAGCRKPIPAWSRCRPSRSNGASPTPCCGSPSNPAARSSTASRSIFPISRQDIAQMTGTTLHTVSRILSGWESRGLIEGGRQRIVLREPHKLFVLAEATSGEDGSLERP